MKREKASFSLFAEILFFYIEFEPDHFSLDLFPVSCELIFSASLLSLRVSFIRREDDI
jgi:hypothetical protein